MIADVWGKIFASAYSICQYAQVHHGAGRHLGAILKTKPSDIVESQKYAFVASIVALLALSLPKLSICVTYLRIFNTDVRGRQLIQGIIVIVLVPLVPFLFFMIFQCKPIEVYWTEGRPLDKCSEDILGLYISGGLNVFVDFALIAVVLPRVLKLQLNARQKWALGGIIGLGFLAAMAGLTRMIRVGTTLVKPNFDATWDAYDISIWTSTEIYVSLICASAPGIKPLVAKMVPKLLGSSLSSRGGTKTTIYPAGSINMGLKSRRGTIGSNRVRPKARDTSVGVDEGFYEQVESGVDRPSFDERKSAEDVDFPIMGIFKTQEFSIRSSVVTVTRDVR
ncbi:hypothetical protein BU26DRAFT_591689 [Trematosphaeria pertusa]|uniref:Rhodopsin domain-containing protein n=1 Tax=Trematosphaeria pertusa TaxID=390896 RepID=A0A6A6IKZ1_9PLEO|nr:uncharacterized protein BU26DRAFT_591689 [Trematosphaeria pertusa]KAF2250738.1 hypothetical protein BU26DRAFT_591689 [Trematosphaeria pertusa]